MLENNIFYLSSESLTNNKSNRATFLDDNLNSPKQENQSNLELSAQINELNELLPSYKKAKSFDVFEQNLVTKNHSAKLFTQSDQAGNTLYTAKVITLGSTPTTYKDSVGTTDSNDYYRFSVTQTSNFNLTLNGLVNDADVQLLDNTGKVLIDPGNYGTTPETINAQLVAGTYYLSVTPGYFGNTPYNLTVSASLVADAGNTLSRAKIITLGSTPTTYKDWIGATDTNDYYRFAVAKSSTLNLTLNGLVNDADVQLLDNTGTVITESDSYGAAPETMNFDLDPGTYYIRVFPGFISNTPYNLTANLTLIPVIPGYSKINGYGLVNAAAAVAKATNKTPFPEVPNLGSNDWGADLIKAPEVWAKGYTGQGIVVAVLDTGVDRNHPDLNSNIWKNTKEIAGDAIDNDKNGYIDDVYGWNFTNNTNNTLDVYGHGTHVAGTIAGLKNNFGVTGIAYNAKIMPVKVLGDDGSGSELGVAQGVRYAVNNGGKVINMSLGGDIDDPSLRSAVQYASSKGVIVVMAAGNDSATTSMNNYPGSYATQWGLAVGAVDRYSNMAYFSNRAGTTNLAYVTAPGVSVYSTVPNNSYASYDGTSMATPHVAGVVALMLSANPNLTDAQVRQLITSTAVNPI